MCESLSALTLDFLQSDLGKQTIYARQYSRRIKALKSCYQDCFRRLRRQIAVLIPSNPAIAHQPK